MKKVLGTGIVDTFLGDDDGNIFFGEGGADEIIGGIGDDIIYGGGGNDTLSGSGGADTIYGSVSAAGAVDFNKFQIAESATGTVTFVGESAGYKNTLGVYKIADDGSIYDVQVLFANASLKGSGGDLVSGKSAVNLDLKAGDKLGFFIVPNGYQNRAGDKQTDVLNSQSGAWTFVDADGKPGNVNGGVELTLVHTSANGTSTSINSQYGTSVFHSHGGAEGGLNGDKYNHVVGKVDVQAGTIEIGFEDLKNGGDEDFDDSVFVVDIGTTNAALLPKEQTKPASSTDDDVISGGAGNDVLFGMRGDDIIDGGDGDDTIWGNSGNDAIDGGEGNDVITGGAGTDKISGGEGNDQISGNSGDDVLDGGDGDDAISGNSGNDTLIGGLGVNKLDGGSGDDLFIGGAGSDTIIGGSGFDTLDYSAAKGGLTVDLSKHTVSGSGTDIVWSIESFIGSGFDDVIKGDKRDNVINGGAGNDVIRGLGGEDTLIGGDGNDRFVWFMKDVIDGETGKHLGVDVIKDLSFGDVIDLQGITKDLKYASIEDVVSVRDGDNGAIVSVRFDNAFVDVVTVEGYSAADLAADGLILT